MSTNRYDAIRRELSYIEDEHRVQGRHFEAAVKALSDYRQELEELIDIACELLGEATGVSAEDALEVVGRAWEMRQGLSLRAATVGETTVERGA